MNFSTLFLIALSLSMDAFAVAVCNGISYGGQRRTALLTACSFGLAQGFMPVLGYFAGVSIGDTISAYDHWIAFMLLSIIGGKMLRDGIHEFNQPLIISHKQMYLGLKLVMIQAIATSIDALAVGISFAALQVNIFEAALLITITTFICSFIGSYLGQTWGIMLKRWATIVGGLILCLLGIKILAEHLGYF